MIVGCNGQLDKLSYAAEVDLSINGRTSTSSEVDKKVKTVLTN